MRINKKIIQVATFEGSDSNVQNRANQFLSTLHEHDVVSVTHQAVLDLPENSQVIEYITVVYKKVAE